ncbi:hypothetical protein VNI00_010648 [Paramarasmius palmivorus]|uniref:Uncharacterized protein n=1 Tax=Paramarasmius palmivorus TaxID=297713 RepID=A0AAW0BAZ9_9AGAR
MSRTWYEFEVEFARELSVHRNLMSFDSEEGRMITIPWPIDYYGREFLPVEEVVRLIDTGKIKVFCFHEGLEACLVLRNGVQHLVCGRVDPFLCCSFSLNLDLVQRREPTLTMYYPKPSAAELNRRISFNVPRDSMNDELNEERRKRKAAKAPSASTPVASGSSNEGGSSSRKRQRSSSAAEEPIKRRAPEASNGEEEALESEDESESDGSSEDVETETSD